MKQSLYVIEKEYQEIMNTLEDEGGIMSIDMEESLKINDNEFYPKCAAYGFKVMEKIGNVSLRNAEIKRLQSLNEADERIIDNLKNRVSDAMINRGVQKIETPMLKLSFRKSESVDIQDESLLDAKYFSYRPTIDKTAIKNDIKAGILVEGATIISKDNLQIK